MRQTLVLIVTTKVFHSEPVYILSLITSLSTFTPRTGASTNHWSRRFYIYNRVAHSYYL